MRLFKMICNKETKGSKIRKSKYNDDQGRIVNPYKRVKKKSWDENEQQ